MNLPRDFFKNSASGYVLTLILAALSHSSFGQLSTVDNLVTAYQENINNAYSTQWTIGEIFTGTFTSGDLVVSSGINDNTIVYIVMDLESAGNATMNSYRAFPNPMTGLVTVRSENVFMDEAVFRFADGSGREVSVPIVEVDKYEATFNTEGLKAGFYMLTIQNLKTRQYAHIKLVQK
ncbi:MAG TPA: T9SS type A sorting domain-containing protein [Chryseosolibacter sp.]